MPGLTVIIPSFNHGQFVERSIRSVLEQTFDQFEVIVIDDASTDNSAQIIQGISDDRLRKVYLEKNTGGASVLNLGIKMSTGDYIAICNSDDEWMPDKLVKQLPVISTYPNVGAVFTDVQWIDERNRVLSRSDLAYHDVFQQPNRSNFKWLHDLIEDENCLCHPSILIRRSVYDSCGLYENRYRQFPDYDMWIRIVEKHDILIMRDKTVKFRKMRDKQNTSSDQPANTTRALNEWELIFSKTFNRLDKETFVRSFGSVKSPDEKNFCLPLEKCLYLLNFKTPHLRSLCASIARKIFFEFADTADTVAILKSYGLPGDFLYAIQGLSSAWIQRKSLGSLTDDEKHLLSLTRARSTDPIIDPLIRDLPIEKFRSISEIRTIMESRAVPPEDQKTTFIEKYRKVENLRNLCKKIGAVFQSGRNRGIYLTEAE